MNLRWGRQLHISWHIAWVSAGVLGGAAQAPAAPDYLFAHAAWLVAAGFLLFVVFLKRWAAFACLAILAGILIGLWRGAVEQQALAAYRPFYKRQVSLRGKISEDAVVGTQGDLRLRLSDVQINRQAMKGQVWVSTSTNIELKRGDILTAKGLLNQGFGNLPAAMYRAKATDVERPYPGDVGRRVRDWFAAGVRRAIPEPEASLGTGYLVGQRSTLPEQLDGHLRLLGLTHVVVASGYNLTILVRFARRAFARISKYLSTLAASAMIGGFVLITGFSPSMSRAALVTGLSLAAWYYGRRIQPLVLLPFAAAVTVLVNPAYVWGDIGWYLSFAAFAGVIILSPLLSHFFFGIRKQPGAFRQIFIETSAAQLVTLPIIAFTFGQYAPLAVPANMLILPLIPLTMMFTFFAGVAGIALPGYAAWVGLPASAILHYMTSLANRLAGLPAAYGEVNFGLAALIASYIAILVFVLWLWRKTGHEFGRDNIVE